ncbi:MAG: DHH family phosphoesterase [Bacillota bacterium]
MNRSNLKRLNELINKSKRIAVVSHQSPDGDNLGSLLAVGISLESLGKEVLFVKADIVPADYDFFPGIDKLEAIDYSTEDVDLLLVMDCSDLKRLGENQFLIDKSNKIVNIDHHVSNTEFGDINIVMPDLSSTGEILFNILEELQLPINTDIATLIYAAMSTDTGRFTYQGVTGRTHKTVAKLYDYGIDAYNINTKLYQRRSLARTRLFIRAASQIAFYYENKVGVVKVSQKMLEATGASMEDTEGIVEFIRDTDSIEAALLLKEIDENMIKISLRTKGAIDANKICGAFNGGGHSRASGATMDGTLEVAEKIILEEIGKYL